MALTYRGLVPKWGVGSLSATSQTVTPGSTGAVPVVGSAVPVLGHFSGATSENTISVAKHTDGNGENVGVTTYNPEKTATFTVYVGASTVAACNGYVLPDAGSHFTITDTTNVSGSSRFQGDWLVLSCSEQRSVGDKANFTVNAERFTFALTPLGPLAP